MPQMLSPTTEKCQNTSKMRQSFAPARRKGNPSQRNVNNMRRLPHKTPPMCYRPKQTAHRNGRNARLANSGESAIHSSTPRPTLRIGNPRLRIRKKRPGDLHTMEMNPFFPCKNQIQCLENLMKARPLTNECLEECCLFWNGPFSGDM